MDRTIVIPDTLYDRLEAEARRRRLSVQQLLEVWERTASELRRREEQVREIDRIRADLSAKYGDMPDSTELIREDRDRQ